MQVLYRAIIPAGAKLTDSKAMEGAVHGIYHGTDGIRGHANLVAVEVGPPLEAAVIWDATPILITSVFSVPELPFYNLDVHGLHFRRKQYRW